MLESVPAKKDDLITKSTSKDQEIVVLKEKSVQQTAGPQSSSASSASIKPKSVGKVSSKPLSSSKPAASKKPLPRQSTLQFQPKQTCLQFQSSASKDEKSGNTGSISLLSSFSKKTHPNLNLFDEFESKDVDSLDPKLFTSQLPILDHSDLFLGDSIFQLITIFQFLSKFGSIFFEFDDFEMSSLDDLTKLFRSPSSYFQKFLRIYEGFICKLSGVKKIALENVQRQVVAYLIEVNEDALDLGKRFGSVDFPFIQNELHLKTLLFLIDRSLPVINDSIPLFKEKLKIHENDRVALLVELDVVNSSLAKIVSNQECSAEMHSLPKLVEMKAELQRLIQKETKNITHFKDYIDEFTSGSSFLEENLLGFDRFGNGYWWISPFFNLDNFGIIVEPSLYSIKNETNTASSFAGPLVIQSKQNLDSFLASLLKNGKKEKTLSTSISTKIKSLSDASIHEAFSRFDSWINSFRNSETANDSAETLYHFHFQEMIDEHLYTLGTACGMKKSQLKSTLGKTTFSFRELKELLIEWHQQSLLVLLTEKQLVWLYELNHYSDLLRWAITCSRDATREIERASIVKEIEKKKLKQMEKLNNNDNEVHGKRNAALAAITKVGDLNKVRPRKPKIKVPQKRNSRPRRKSAQKTRTIQSSSSTGSSSASDGEKESDNESVNESDDESNDESDDESENSTKFRRTSLRSSISRKVYKEDETESD